MSVSAPNVPGYKTIHALRHAIEKRLAQGQVKLPMMPQVASKVMSMTNDPNVDVSDLSDLIHRDPALAARVLKVANSVVFGGSQEITSLPEAVTRLGLNTLSEITLSASLQAGVFRAPGFEEKVHKLWRHALGSAYYAKEVAKLKGTDPEALFLCGLLHAIGKPAVLQLIADLRQEHPFLIEPAMLEQLLDEFHPRLGSQMATQWQLPTHVQVVCAYYTCYAEAPSYREEAAMACLADLLATALLDPDGVQAKTLREHPVLEFLELSANDLERLIALQDVITQRMAALEQ